MAEQVAATPVDAAPQQSLDDKIAAKMGFGNEPEAPAETPEPTDEAPEQEAQADDAEEFQPEDEPSEPEDGFEEIKHNGQVKRLSKEQLRDFAQKGFDYESKMVETKAERQRLQNYAKALEAREAAALHSVEAIAEAKAYEKQLQQYQSTDWIKFSNDDPITAFQERQKYDALVNGYNLARQRAAEALNQRGSAEQAMSEEQLAFERKALVDKVPAWKEQAVYDKEWPEITKWAAQRFGEDGFSQIAPFLNSHITSVLLRNSWKYERAIEAQKAKKQPAVPAMPKPGSPQGRLSKGEMVKEGIKSLHQAKDPSRKKALFDDVLAAKFGLK